MSVLRRRMFQQGGAVVPPEVEMTQQGVQQVMGDINSQIDQAQNFEQMINVTRDEQAPLEQRYQELAMIVGPEDAMQTPESVLALAQPVIENALMDEGIGGLAQEQMTQPVTPEMAGGIMEMTEQPQQPMQPVQPVQQFQEGGAVSLKDYYQQNLPLIQEIMGSSGEAKKQAQGQALLDIAQRAFLYGSGVNPASGQGFTGRESEAQKLAALLASSTTPISEQLAAYNKLEQAEKAQALEMALSQKSAADAAKAVKTVMSPGDVLVGPDNKLLYAAPTQDSAFMEKIKYLDEFTTLSNEEKYLLAQSGPTDFMNKQKVIEYLVKQGVGTEAEITKKVFNIDQGPVKNIPRDIFDNLPKVDQEALVLNQGPVKGIPRDLFNGLSADMQSKILVGNPENVLGIPRDVWDGLTETEKKMKINNLPSSVKNIPLDIWKDLPEETKKNILDPTSNSPVNGIPRDIYNGLSPVDQANLVIPDASVKGIPRNLFDTFNSDQQAKILGLVDPEKSVKGVPLSIYKTLSEEKKDMLLGVNEKIKGVPRDMFDRFSADQQERLLGIAEDNIKIMGDSAVDFTDPQNPVVVFSSVPDFRKKIEELASFTDMTRAEATMAVLGPDQTVKGVPLNIYENLEPVQQNTILGLTKDPIKVGDSLISVDDPEKPKVIFTNDKIIKFQNEVIKIKGDGTVESLYTSPGEKNKKLRVLTDKSNPTYQYYFYEDSQEGAEIIGKANDPKFLGQFSINTISGFEAPKPQAFLIDSDGDNNRDQVVTTFDGVSFILRNQNGKYVDKNNEISDNPVFVQLQDYNPLQIQDSTAFTLNKAQNRELTASSELNELVKDVDNLRSTDEVKVSEEDKTLIKTSMDHAKAGTGLASGFWALINNSLGQFIPAATFSETMISRDYVKAVDILGRVGLASNQRFAITELLQISQLFPTVSIFKNPETESHKYVKIKQIANKQLEANLRELASGKYTDDVIVRETQYLNKKIRSLLLLLEGVPDSLPSLSDDTVSVMKQSVKKKKDN